MAYVEVPDPVVLDITAWGNLINTVNQHSSTLSSITDNLGSSTSNVNWESATELVATYSLGNQKIVYGRTRVDFDETNTQYTTNKNLYWGEIPFTSNSFKAKPIVTVTVQNGATSINDTSDASANAICSTFAVNKDSFSYRIMNSRSHAGSGTAIPLTGHLYINWTAIGPA